MLRISVTAQRLLEMRGWKESGVFFGNGTLRCWGKTFDCSGIRQNSPRFGVPRNSGEFHYEQIPVVAGWGSVCEFSERTQHRLTRENHL